MMSVLETAIFAVSTLTASTVLAATLASVKPVTKRTSGHHRLKTAKVSADLFNS